MARTGNGHIHTDPPSFSAQGYCDRVLVWRQTDCYLKFAKKGGVAEETWDEFTMGRPWVSEDAPSDLPWWRVLLRARSLPWRPYNLLTWNCESFVSECFGLKAQSRQVEAVLVASLIGLFAIAMSASG